MKMLKPVGLFIGGLLVGAIASAWWSSHAFLREPGQKSVEMGFRAAQEAEWLAQLRLNETAKVIEQLEEAMDGGVLALARWDEVAALDEGTRQVRDKWLVPVKVYHDSYPARGERAALVNAMLANVPERMARSTCRSGICRLDDLRRGVASAGPNAAAQ